MRKKEETRESGEHIFEFSLTQKAGQTRREKYTLKL